MENVSSNIKFNYLHRDEGNYKLFGSMVFSNKNNSTLGEVENAIREKLIDGEFFYPKEWEVDLLDPSHTSEFFIGWYEFEGVEFICENTKGDIRELLVQIGALKVEKY